MLSRKPKLDQIALEKVRETLKPRIEEDVAGLAEEVRKLLIEKFSIPEIMDGTDALSTLKGSTRAVSILYMLISPNGKGEIPEWLYLERMKHAVEEVESRQVVEKLNDDSELGGPNGGNV